MRKHQLVEYIYCKPYGLNYTLLNTLAKLAGSRGVLRPPKTATKKGNSRKGKLSELVLPDHDPKVPAEIKEFNFEVVLQHTSDLSHDQDVFSPRQSSNLSVARVAEK
jgi:hypothetical protein